MTKVGIELLGQLKNDPLSKTLWKNFIKIVKFGHNCDFFVKIVKFAHNLVAIVKFGCNCEIWSKL